jgi:hypothetical protein
MSFLMAGAMIPQACGCNDTPSGDDGGAVADAGSTVPDSGPIADAGDLLDAGPVVDAGPLADAGSQEDGGGANVDAGVIIPPVGGVGITSASVRACDLLFLASQAEVPTITFNAAVRGRFVKGAPQVAASFVAAQDQSLEGVEILEFVYEGPPGAVTLVKADCFDASGAVVNPSGVSINP